MRRDNVHHDDSIDGILVDDLGIDDICDGEAELFISTDDENDQNMDVETNDELCELDKEHEEHVLGLGLLYEDVDALKSIIFNHSLASKKGLKIKKIEKKKLTIVCVDEGCPWRLYASYDKESEKMKIKSYTDNHMCVVSGKNKLMNRQRMIELFLHKLRDNPHLKAVDMRAEVLERYEVRLTLPQCRGARQNCLEILQRDHARQFERLWDYTRELKRSNPGSTIILQTTANVFRRLYVCFSALRDGWTRGCRRVLHMDGAFLKWNLKGEILSAVGRDVNDQLFPVAWAVVDVENTKNWKWFIKCVRDDLVLGLGEGLTVITDQQKGLIAAINKHLPFSEHRNCARHIWSNFKKLHSSEEVRRCFWWAAKSYTTHSFEQSMEELKDFSIGAYNDLQRYDPKHWSRAFFSTISKCDCVDNNFSESFNASIRDARTKPVVQMLELIRKGVMTSNARKLEDMDSHSVSTCSCRYWELTGIPCAHIISAFWNENKGCTMVENYVNDLWTSQYWKLSYQDVLQPVNGENLWDKTTDVTVIPPPSRKMPGRPSKNARKKDAFESPRKRKDGRVITCQHCQGKGHNIRGCPAKDKPPVTKEPEPSRPRGRPRKTPLSPIGTSIVRKQKRVVQSKENANHVASGTQPEPQSFQVSEIPIREGCGVYVSPYSGDTYVHLGKHSVDTMDNTNLPIHLQKKRDKLKMKKKMNSQTSSVI